MSNWKTGTSSFTDKILKNKRITLVEEKKVISENAKKVVIFNEYFGKIAKKLGFTERPHIGDSIRNV